MLLLDLPVVFSCSYACRFPMTLMKNHLQPWAASLPRGNFPDIKNSFKSLAEGPIYRLQWLVAGTLKVQGFLGKGSNRLMDEASTNRNFFVSGRWSFHAIPHWKMPKHKHQIKDETHRTIPLEYTGNFDENSDEYMAMDQYLLIPFLGGWTSIYQLFWCSPGVQGFDPLPY